jgi:putative hemolysin
MTLFQADYLRVELIDGNSDLTKIMELRTRCFLRSFESNDFDLRAKHLVVVDVKTQAVVGAYRLMASPTNLESQQIFESQEDFDLSDWLKRPGRKVELAWACTHPDYRQGYVIALLWKGLAQFLKSENIQYLFGPASLAGKSQSDLTKTLQYLKDNDFELKESGIEAKWQLPWAQPVSISSLERAGSRRQLPALLRAYLMAGALVLLQPVFDPDTNCFDFLTVLELDHCNENLRQHFDL